MTLRQIHYCIVIADLGSINKAAEVLYVTQPSLTSALKELENELDIEIFTRSGKGVTLTNDGVEFMLYARQLYSQYEELTEKFIGGATAKKKFCVSTQHYSFAVKAFVEMVKTLDTLKYEFAIRETKTKDVIDDVAKLRSEIGIIYMSNFNRMALTKILKANDLEFHKLIDCRAYVYLWKDHPLAKAKSLSIEQLNDYPCLSFEQGDTGSFYFAEEISALRDYPRIIKVCDRATVLNLMVGLNGYTICSGIICEELNGNDYVAVPFDNMEREDDDIMEIGYILRKNTVLSKTGSKYVKEIRDYLSKNMI